MASPYIIGLGHRRRVGKDTLGNLIVQDCLSYGISATRVAFGDKVKSIAFELYSWAGLQAGEYYDSHPEDREVALPAIGMSPREIWIEVGCKLREVYPETWLEAAFAKAKDFEVLIVTDVRFPNEVDAIRDRGGEVIKVERPGIKPSHDQADSALASFDEWDAIVFNEVGIEGLEEIARELTTEIAWKVFEGDEP